MVTVSVHNNRTVTKTATYEDEEEGGRRKGRKNRTGRGEAEEKGRQEEEDEWEEEGEGEREGEGRREPTKYWTFYLAGPQNAIKIQIMRSLDSG